MPEYDPSKTYMTVAEAATSLGVHPATMRNATQEGRIPYVRLYGRILIAPDDVEAYRERTRGPEGDVPRGRPRKK